MPNVEFSEEKAYNAELERSARARGTTPRGGLRYLPIRLGLAKDETGAMLVLVIVGAVALVLAVVVFLGAV